MKTACAPRNRAGLLRAALAAGRGDPVLCAAACSPPHLEHPSGPHRPGGSGSPGKPPPPAPQAIPPPTPSPGAAPLRLPSWRPPLWIISPGRERSLLPKPRPRRRRRPEAGPERPRFWEARALPLAGRRPRGPSLGSVPGGCRLIYLRGLFLSAYKVLHHSFKTCTGFHLWIYSVGFLSMLFNVSVEVIMWFLSFIQLIHITLLNFCMLNQFCISVGSPT